MAKSMAQPASPMLAARSKIWAAAKITSNEAWLLFRVFWQAVDDLRNAPVRDRADAILYLTQPHIKELELIGIDSGYARNVLKKLGIV